MSDTSIVKKMKKSKSFDSASNTGDANLLMMLQLSGIDTLALSSASTSSSSSSLSSAKLNITKQTSKVEGRNEKATKVVEIESNNQKDIDIYASSDTVETSNSSLSSMATLNHPMTNSNSNRINNDMNNQMKKKMNQKSPNELEKETIKETAKLRFNEYEDSNDSKYINNWNKETERWLRIIDNDLKALSQTGSIQPTQKTIPTSIEKGKGDGTHEASGKTENDKKGGIFNSNDGTKKGC